MPEKDLLEEQVAVLICLIERFHTSFAYTQASSLHDYEFKEENSFLIQCRVAFSSGQHRVLITQSITFPTPLWHLRNEAKSVSYINKEEIVRSLRGSRNQQALRASTSGEPNGFFEFCLKSCELRIAKRWKPVGRLTLYFSSRFSSLKSRWCLDTTTNSLRLFRTHENLFSTRGTSSLFTVRTPRVRFCLFAARVPWPHTWSKRAERNVKKGNKMVCTRLRGKKWASDNKPSNWRLRSDRCFNWRHNLAKLSFSRCQEVALFGQPAVIYITIRNNISLVLRRTGVFFLLLRRPEEELVEFLPKVIIFSPNPHTNHAARMTSKCQ